MNPEANNQPTQKGSAGGITLSAVLGLVAGLLAGVNFVDKSSREEAVQTATLGAHEQKLESLREAEWYAKGERAGAASKITAVEKELIRASYERQLIELRNQVSILNLKLEQANK